MSNILGIATKYPWCNHIRCHHTQEIQDQKKKRQEAWHNIDRLRRVTTFVKQGKKKSVFIFIFLGRWEQIINLKIFLNNVKFENMSRILQLCSCQLQNSHSKSHH